MSDIKESPKKIEAVPLVARVEDVKMAAATEAIQAADVKRMVERVDDVKMVAFVNPRSGGQVGQTLEATLRKLLGSEAVFDLTETGADGKRVQPEKGLATLRGRPDVRVLACGGDGTVNWILSTIQRMHFDQDPAVGILPMGTGNDTSRQFGWGKTFEGTDFVVRSVEQARRAEATPFDRWQLSISHPKAPSASLIKQYPVSLVPVASGSAPAEAAPAAESKGDGKAEVKREEALPDEPAVVVLHSSDSVMAARQAGSAAAASASSAAPPSLLVRNWPAPTSPPTIGQLYDGEFNNYLSFGLDAQIMYKFHHAREHQCRACFCCPCMNKFCIFCCGCSATCCCAIEPVTLTAEVVGEDGQWRALELPAKTSAIVLLNLKSYGGGNKLWPDVGKPDEKGETKDKRGLVRRAGSVSDGLIEVVAVTSQFHLARIVSGCSPGLPLAQASEVRLTSSVPVFVQMDGEPWRDEVCTYHVRRLPRQALVLQNGAAQTGCCSC